jgi:hypothetical protein
VIDEQAWLNALNSGRAGPLVGIADPEIEVFAAALGTEGRVYMGHDGLRRWMREVRERFHARSRSDSITWLGDDALMIQGLLFMSDEIGDDREQPFAMVVHLRRDKASWIGTFFSADEARSAYERGVTGPHSG